MNLFYSVVREAATTLPEKAFIRHEYDTLDNRTAIVLSDSQDNLHGKHYNIEIDTQPSSSRRHQQRIPHNDPNARNTFWHIDNNGNKKSGFSMC